MSDIDKFRKKVEEHQESLEEIRSETSFEDCQKIKRAGELYRETGSIRDVADGMGLNNEETQNLIKKYITIIKYPTDRYDFRETARGVGFYGGQNSLEELCSEYDASEEEIKKGLRDFVGLTLDENQITDTDISRETIPENAVYPPSFIKTYRQLRKTAQNVAQQALTDFDASKLELKEIATINQRLAQTIRESILPLQASFAELAQKFRKEVAEAIRDGISNFDPPEEYDPDAVQVNSLASEVAVHSLEEFTETIREEKAESLYPYLPRLEAILEGYTEGHYYTPIYAAISVQDGLMTWLCEHLNIDSTETNRFDELHYKWDKKRDILASRYEGWYDVETDVVLPNLEEFYRHRNAIMHGDPLAYFDKNIATVSILFLNLTLYTVIDALED